MPTTTTSKLQQIEIGQLVLDPVNARTHTRAQIEQIATSIDEFGWSSPVVVDDRMNVIAGHGRIASQRLRWHGRRWQTKTPEEFAQTKIPVIVISGLTPNQVSALRLADNRIAENAGWDEEMLRSTLESLECETFSLEDLGFEAKELDELLDRASTTEEAADTGPQVGDVSFGIVVDCKGESDQADLLARFKKEGLTCRPLMS